MVINDEDLKIRLKDGLNNDQTNAFDSIMEFFDESEIEAFVLKGYAGTGKTFLVKRVVEYINTKYPNRRIAITAPTNKAVKVLQMAGMFSKDNKDIFSNLFESSPRIAYSTIHKLLGLKEQISANGEQSFVADKSAKTSLADFKYLIVDEVSMLDDMLCAEILRFADKVCVIFMGE